MRNTVFSKILQTCLIVVLVFGSAQPSMAQGTGFADEIDISQLRNIPLEWTIKLFEEIELVFDPRTFDESGLIYQVFDLPPGLRFERDKNAIVGRPTTLGTYTFTVLVDSDWLPIESTLPPVIRQFKWTVELPELLPPDPDHSVARQWNDVLLEAIRKDTARPTVHARNLFHVSSAMYDAWALYDDVAAPYLLGNSIVDGECPLHDQIDLTQMTYAEIEAARHETLSYAAYRVLSWRFQNSPGQILSQTRFDHLMDALGYNITTASADLCKLSGNVSSAAVIGNYIAQTYIDFGMIDGANENDDYASRHYSPINRAIPVKEPIQQFDAELPLPTIINRWSPLAFDVFIGQANFVTYGGAPEFVSPEWGQVVPFALSDDELTIYERDGNEYWVYHDPGEPPYFADERQNEATWGYLLVPLWASYLDPADGVTIGISPASIGNNQEYDASFEFMQSFYSSDGGDNSPGHALNPATNQPYTPNIVPRADYGRVIAEFWADGPDSETPPGHWFTILNEIVTDDPELVKRYRGDGEIVDDLEWDIKAYFALGGAMHDSAISAWGIKGWYDYARPISAVRYMAYFGQDTAEGNGPEHPFSLPEIPGFIERITADDPLADGENVLATRTGTELIIDPERNVDKYKMYTWRGPDYIEDEKNDVAGVGWILAEEWWPYQRPTFVTPPFAGYVSGHSTYSRAAAEVLTLLTGDRFFPGGMGEHFAPQNEFLVFEDGPSQDITLQWATYQDAADQSAISRIWGGIHPPADDMPARLIGEKIGKAAFAHAEKYFAPRAQQDKAPIVAPTVEPNTMPTEVPSSTAAPTPTKAATPTPTSTPTSTPTPEPTQPPAQEEDFTPLMELLQLIFDQSR